MNLGEWKYKIESNSRAAQSELEGKDWGLSNQWTFALRIKIRSSSSNIINEFGGIRLSPTAELINSLNKREENSMDNFMDNWKRKEGENKKKDRWEIVIKEIGR